MYKFIDNIGDRYYIDFQYTIDGPFLSIDRYHNNRFGSISIFARKLIPPARIILWEGSDIPLLISEETMNYIDRLYKNKAFM